MSKEDIFEGVKQAISKGEPLERAITSFFNAGYPSEDIEEATRTLQPLGISQSQFQQPKQKIPLSQPVLPALQMVSDYGKPPNKTGAAITIVLFTLLLLLLGILAAVILFKDELTNFFTNLFLRALL